MINSTDVTEYNPILVAQNPYNTPWSRVLLEKLTGL
jgi:hypothetical protein